ncbi:hypothetical protein M569_17358 [Genlisea aurea]|uniref:Uncharacterized protein n=1 Tax=Genlisea aurea TaxID=192259 RepID=S8BSU5_9LAMI|nr:hypothetical protein M569_17358 [Genlisea aurea]
MGNSISCFDSKSDKAAKLIDLHRNLQRLVDVPITASELMLEEPGRAISPLSDFRLNRRICAMRADDVLSGGGTYVLIPIHRVNRRVTEAEMAILDSIAGSRRSGGFVRRRGSRVLPVAAPSQICAAVGEGTSRLPFVEEIGFEMVNRRRTKEWKPVLESIAEGKKDNEKHKFNFLYFFYDFI